MRADHRTGYAEDIIGRLEGLVAECKSAGNRSLAYFIDIALAEARIQAARGELKPPKPVIEGTLRRIEER